MSDTALEIVQTPRGDMVRAEDFMPVFTVQQAVDRKQMVNQFISQVLKDGEDFGDIPGASKKKVLLKPGAEKLCSIFGLAPNYVKEVIVEDWTGRDHDGEPLFSYEYRCQLYRGGRFMGEAIGSCNSWESKYRYRWVPENALPAGMDKSALPSRSSTVTEFGFAIDKAETSGQYGKPAEYWQRWREAIQSGEARQIVKKSKAGKDLQAWEMGGAAYRLPNPDVADIINTCQKMAQKRALVAAVLVVTNCSDAFTQDMEDFQEPEHSTPPAQPTNGVEMPVNLPAELQALFQKVVPPGATTTAFQFVRDRLMEALPQNGEDEFRRILNHNGIKEKGNSILIVRNAAMQCWALAQKLKAKTSTTDMPEGQGRDDWTEGRE